MAFRHSKRRLELVPFEASTSRSIKIPRDRFIKHIDLLFRATVTVTGGSGAGLIDEDAALKLCPLIEVRANGVTTLFRMSAQDLYFKNTFEFGTRPYVLDPTDDVAGDYEIGFFVRIDFRNNVGICPADTFLPAPLFKSLDLVVTWADPLTALFDSDADGTAAISSAYGIRPVIHETTQPRPNLVRLQDYIEKEVTATTTEFWLDLPPGDRIYQDVMFKTMDTNTKAGTVRENDIIRFINLITDEAFHHVQMLPWENHQAANKVQYSLEDLYEGAGLCYPPVDGLLYLYLLEDGRVKSGLNVFDVNTARFICDVVIGTATTTVRLIHDSIMPLKYILH